MSMALIDQAAAHLAPHRSGDRLIGDVAAAVVAASGSTYVGVSVDTPSWGLCAERSAMAAMITAGEYVVTAVVAVWRDDADGRLRVLPPCGVCREFMRQVDTRNLDAAVVVDADLTVPLADLLPRHEWPGPLATSAEP